MKPYATDLDKYGPTKLIYRWAISKGWMPMSSQEKEPEKAQAYLEQKARERISAFLAGRPLEVLRCIRTRRIGLLADFVADTEKVYLDALHVSGNYVFLKGPGMPDPGTRTLYVLVDPAIIDIFKEFGRITYKYVNNNRTHRNRKSTTVEKTNVYPHLDSVDSTDSFSRRRP